MLGRLARWLRVLGYDVVYLKKPVKGELWIKAKAEDRMVLTRNTHYQKKQGFKVFLIKENKVIDQLAEVIKGLNLHINTEKLFTRCIDCNVSLSPIPKAEVKGKVPIYIYNTQKHFSYCPDCKRIYWWGTHGERFYKFLSEKGVLP